MPCSVNGLMGTEECFMLSNRTRALCACQMYTCKPATPTPKQLLPLHLRASYPYAYEPLPPPPMRPWACPPEALTGKQASRPLHQHTEGRARPLATLLRKAPRAGPCGCFAVRATRSPDPTATRRAHLARRATRRLRRGRIPARPWPSRCGPSFQCGRARARPSRASAGEMTRC